MSGLTQPELLRAYLAVCPDEDGQLQSFADDMMVSRNGRVFPRRPVRSYNVHPTTHRCYGCNQPLDALHQGYCSEEKCPVCGGLFGACRCPKEDMPVYKLSDAVQLVRDLMTGVATYLAHEADTANSHD